MLFLGLISLIRRPDATMEAVVYSHAFVALEGARATVADLYVVVALGHLWGPAQDIVSVW